jgi:hypothetical protein
VEVLIPNSFYVMKRYHLLLSLPLATSILLSSCASRLTPAQRAELSTVAIERPTVDSNAYEEPYAGDIEMRNNAANAAGASGGALGALIGSAIGSGIAGTQNNNFQRDNKAYVAAVKKNTPTDLDQAFAKKLKVSMNGYSFFRGKVVDNSSNLVTSYVSCYRLVRAAKNDQGTIIFTPEIYVDIKLKDSKGKKLVGGSYVGTSVGAAPIADYANNSVRTKQAFDTCVSDAVSHFMGDLDAKLNK